MAKITPSKRKGPGRPAGSKNRTTPIVKAKNVKKDDSKAEKAKTVKEKFEKLIMAELETKMNEVLVSFAKETTSISSFCKKAAQYHLKKVKETTGEITEEDITYVLNLGHRMIKHHCDQAEVEVVKKQ